MCEGGVERGRRPVIRLLTDCQAEKCGDLGHTKWGDLVHHDLGYDVRSMEGE